MMRTGVVAVASWDMHYSELPTEPALERVGFNTGNLAFGESIKRSISGPIHKVGWQTEPEWVDDNCGALVVGAANWIGSHSQLGTLPSLIAQTRVPVIIAGIGIQADMDEEASPSASALELLEALRHRREVGRITRVLTRGDLTTGFLAARDVEAAPIGCPSVWLRHDRLEPGPLWSRAGPPRLAIGVIGNSSSASHLQVDRQMFRSGRGTDWLVVIQETLAMVQLVRGEEPSRLDTVENLGARYGLPPAKFRARMRRAGQVFFDVEPWLEYYRRADLVVGTRFHGTMLAVQAGVPAVIIVHDSRTSELADFTRIPKMTMASAEGGLASAAMAALERFDDDAYRQRRLQSATSYVQALDDCAIPVRETLRALVESA